MKYSVLLLSGIIGLLFVGCGAIKDKTTIFSAKEKELILSGKADEPMYILQINKPKDSVILRSKSKAFKVNPQNTVLQYFTKRLYATVRDSSARGVGIAAPQVGILKQIIWVQRLDKDDEPFEVYYNPQITQYSGLKQDVPEGCLSVPDFRATTHDRSYAILIEYDNSSGAHKCEMVEAFTAAIFQHEIDHLNGIMFTDHLQKEQKASIRHSLE